MVDIRDLTIEYPLPGGETVKAVESAAAVFPAGSISAVLGPSGCGKTSIIHAAAGLLKPLSGRITIDGIPVSGIRKTTSVIFQDYGLLPWKTVLANAELPLTVAGMEKSRRRERVLPILEEFGLWKFRKLYPRQLSGGMKQRLAIARSLAAEPDLLLMDEPFSSLDALTREDAQDFLLSVRKKRNLTIIMVTHSIEEAVYLSENVFVMTGRNPGTISKHFAVQKDEARDFREDPRFQELCGTIRHYLKDSREENR
ncbi:ABC transporter ATP-binding protein [Breznakiella homolactica]|uniref:ABC transporter ATP-binding protein n=1 Tax=Breznakiella homolactica TaxID=2798577 RepID=A0A7T7XQ23_9SPIR|nr:ABC transporter ATP-binding protein [Breznakiella homolactica]QQO10426.1 ABC transporter ATP-binding protein [Breznakiella homolactica]